MTRIRRATSLRCKATIRSFNIIIKQTNVIITHRTLTIMKHLYALAALCCTALTAQAEIHPDYAAPTQVSVEYFDTHAHLYFLAPAMGGPVFAPVFSNATGLDGMTTVGEGDAWYNTGAGGSEISTTSPSMSGTATALATPTLSLTAATTYTLSFQSCGSRSTGNQSLAVALYRGDALVKTIVEPAELAPSLGWTTTTADVTVDETADDYSVRFIFTPGSGKAGGANLRTIAIAAPVPEGRGALTGYAMWRNEALVATFAADDAVLDRLYYTLTDPEPLAEDASTYTYALQALYEGGESPLSTAAVLTTPDGITAVTLAPTAAAVRYDIVGRRATTATRGITVAKDGKRIVQ